MQRLFVQRLNDRIRDSELLKYIVEVIVEHLSHEFTRTCIKGNVHPRLVRVKEVL